MAQVTMTGTEYAELLKKEQKLQDLMGWFLTNQQIKFPEGSLDGWSDGNWPKQKDYPDFLFDTLVKDMENQLILMPNEEFERWVVSEKRYFDPYAHCFRNYNYDHTVDMLEYSAKLKFRWDACIALVQELFDEPDAEEVHEDED